MANLSKSSTFRAAEVEKEMPVISTEPSEDELLGGGGDVSPDVVPTDDED